MKNHFFKALDSQITENIKCNSCKKVFYNTNDIEFIKEYGECVRCDKVRGDANDYDLEDN